MERIDDMARVSDDLIPTRRSLLSRLKDWDDQKSWRDFFNTYWKLIYTAARKSGLTDAEAQDVVQETVITVAKKIKELKYDPALGSFKGWLLNTTRWKIADQMRKRKRLESPEEQETSNIDRTAAIERIPDPAGFDLARIWDEDWQKNIVDAAMARVKRQVSPRQYQIFDLYVVKGWAVKKVSETLGVSSTQVHLAKHRISPLLKKAIKRLEAEFI